MQKGRGCQLCHDGNHPLYLCSTFKGLSVEERNNTAFRLKVCTNCLSFTHFFRNCPSSRSCRDCGKKHHSCFISNAVHLLLTKTVLPGKLRRYLLVLISPLTATTHREKPEFFLALAKLLWNLEAGGRRLVHCWMVDLLYPSSLLR